MSFIFNKFLKKLSAIIIKKRYYLKLSEDSQSHYTMYKKSKSRVFVLNEKSSFCLKK